MPPDSPYSIIVVGIACHYYSNPINFLSPLSDYKNSPYASLVPRLPNLFFQTI